LTCSRDIKKSLYGLSKVNEGGVVQKQRKKEKKNLGKEYVEEPLFLP
jgi:hypothetical protein